MSGAKVLIFDDDRNLGAMVKRMIQTMSFEARHLEDPPAFFRDLAEWQPEIVLLDWCMPLMGGAEVLRNVAALRSTAKFVVMSGLGTGEFAAETARAKVAGICIAGTLAKPFTLTTLRTMLNDALK